MEQISVTFHIGRECYRSELSNGRNTIIADEPPEMGGTDLGLNPMELLAGSLGACTGITLRMYADRKGWDLESVNVILTFSFDKEAGKSLIHRRIELTGNLNEEQRNRLLEIANACPIHKTLQNPIEISTQLV